MRLHQLLALAPILAALGGCDFHDKKNYYTYCDETGCYNCDSQGCRNTGPNTNGSCSTNADCTAGCYCDGKSGVCIEAGFCDTNADCSQGMSCDTGRHSCQPTSNPGCQADNQCAKGF